MKKEKKWEKNSMDNVSKRDPKGIEKLLSSDTQSQAGVCVMSIHSVTKTYRENTREVEIGENT